MKSLMVDARIPEIRPPLALALLLCVHTAVCCISLVIVSKWYGAYGIHFDPALLVEAVATTAALSLTSLCFAIAEFSCGFLIGFYIYTMVIGFIWLSFFSKLEYDHTLARVSVVACLLAFTLPSLTITSPLRAIYTLSSLAFRRLPVYFLLFAIVLVGTASTYGFKVVGLAEMYDVRKEIAHPSWMNYFIGITMGALIPYAYACFVARRQYLLAATSLAIALLFYPVTLNKLVMFAPAWLLFLTLLTKTVEAKTAVILSLLLPLASGIVLERLFGYSAMYFFGTVNFRMAALPSSAIDFYADFFSHHPLTWFCQISLLKSLNCPYTDTLGTLMSNQYHIGSFNASTVATEGIASVGLTLAPVSMFFAGLIIALANKMSSGLPPSFVLTSCAILPQTILNVPLSIALLTNGAGLLFLLWYVTPRDLLAGPAEAPIQT